MIGGVITLTVITAIMIFVQRPPAREWGGSQTQTVTMLGAIIIPAGFPRRVSEKLRAAFGGCPGTPVKITLHPVDEKTHVTFTCDAVNSIIYRFSLTDGLSTNHTFTPETDLINQKILDLIIAELKTLGPMRSNL